MNLKLTEPNLEPQHGKTIINRVKVRVTRVTSRDGN